MRLIVKARRQQHYTKHSFKNKLDNFPETNINPNENDECKDNSLTKLLFKDSSTHFSKEINMFDNICENILENYNKLPSDCPQYNKKLWHLDHNIIPNLHSLFNYTEKFKRFGLYEHIQDCEKKLAKCIETVSTEIDRDYV